MASEAGHTVNMNFQLQKVLSGMCSEATKHYNDIDTRHVLLSGCWLKIKDCKADSL